MKFPSTMYVERAMLCITCQLVVSYLYAQRPFWYVWVPAFVVNVCALALLFLSRTDAEAR